MLQDNLFRKWLIVAACFMAILSLISCHVKPVQTGEKTLKKFTATKAIWNDGSSRLLPKQAASTFFLVRHAEKESGDNPGLSNEGVKRAERLESILKKSGITRVYSTDYKRTIATAEPLSKSLRIPIEFYLAGNLERAAKLFIKENQGGKMLIAGHSNTTTALLNILIKKEVLPHILDSDYDNLYLVFLFPDGTSDWWALKF